MLFHPTHPDAMLPSASRQVKGKLLPRRRDAASQTPLGHGPQSHCPERHQPPGSPACRCRRPACGMSCAWSPGADASRSRPAMRPAPPARCRSNRRATRLCSASTLSPRASACASVPCAEGLAEQVLNPGKWRSVGAELLRVRSSNGSVQVLPRTAPEVSRPRFSRLIVFIQRIQKLTWPAAGQGFRVERSMTQ